MASASTSKEYKLAIKIAGAVSSSFDSAIGEAGQKIANLGSIAQAAAETAAAAWGALKLGEFISDAIEIGSEYETAFAKVQTIMDKTQTSSEEMSSAIKALSNETGIAAAELSGSVYDAISATGDTANAVSLVRDATKLATAGFAESGDALSVLTTIMNAYGLSEDEARNISDSLIMTQNRGVTTVGALASSMGKAIATASAYSVDLSNLEASYISLTKAGISTEESTTYLSSMLKELGSANTKVAKIIKSETGKSFGQMMSDGASLADVFDILVKSVNGDSEALINLWSSAEAGKAANAIASQGIDYFRESLDALKNSTGTTESAYETMASTFEFQSKLIKTNWDNLGISIFDSLSGPMARVLKIVNGAMPAVQGAISTAAANIGTMIANGLDYAIPKLTAFKDRAVQIFNDIRPTLERIGAAGQAAFTFLADSAGTAMRGIGDVISSHSGLFEKLGQIAQNVGGIIADIGERLKPVITWAASTALPQVADAVLTVVEKLADLALLISENKALVIALVAAFAGFQGIKGFTSLLTNLDNATKQFERFERVTRGTSLAASAASGKLSPLSVAFGVLTGKIKLADVAQEAYKAKMASLSGGFKTLGTIGKNAFTGLKSGISSIGSTLAGLGSKIMAFVAANPAVLIIAAIAAVIAIVVTLYNKCEWFRNAVDKAIAAVVGFFKDAWETIKEVWQSVAEWFSSNVIQPIVNFFSPIVATLSGFFRGCWIIIQAIWMAVSGWFQANVITPLVSFFSSAVQTVSGFFSGLWAGIQGIWQTVSGWFQSNVIQPLVNFFSPIVESIGGFFSTLWQNIVSVWQAAGAWFQDNVATPINNAFQAVSDFVKGIFNGLIGFVERMINSVIGAINKFIGGFSGIVEKAAGVIGVEWDGIPELPAVTLPRLAQGGIVTAPTLLEAGEAGDEAIIPLPELWGNMQDMIASTMNGATDGIAALADRLEAADIGASNPPIEDLLSRLDNLGNGENPDDGNGPPPMQIIYSPTNHYHFEGDAPSKEDIAGAESMSQEEFNRRMDQWLKDRQRKNFRG